LKLGKSNAKPDEPISVAASGTMKNGAETCLKVE